MDMPKSVKAYQQVLSYWLVLKFPFIKMPLSTRLLIILFILLFLPIEKGSDRDKLFEI